MKKNMGTLDRALRALVGLALIGWGVSAQNWWGAVGLIPLFTATLSWCPLYVPLGINTIKS